MKIGHMTVSSDSGAEEIIISNRKETLKLIEPSSFT